MSAAASRPRLLVLSSTYPRWRDDPEPSFVHELSRRLTADFEVTVLCPHAPGAKTEEELDGVSVERYRYAPAAWETLVHGGGMAANLKRNPLKWLLVPGFLLGQAWAARRIVRRRSVDVLHVHWLIPQGLAVLLLRLLGCRTPYLVTSHGADLYSLRGTLSRTLKRRVAAKSAAMSVVSGAMVEEAARLGLRPPKLEILSMGVDLHGRFVPDTAVRRQADRLLFVGRLVPKKGLPYLLDALPAILAKRPSVRLAIVGFGPEEMALKAQVQRLGLGDRVEFMGAKTQGELPALYRTVSLFVAPFVKEASGDQEGLPVALMEAVGCGCPVIAGEVAGLRDLLGAAADQVCVDPKDSAALAAAILKSLEAPVEASTRALEVRRVALEKVDWSAVASGYSRLLRDCIG
ncbi:MAG TPA: glycosyltransferase [Gammaproteobacteria bacterium]|nr:glycosyltransferase [Gammaproteobacteria bacterium]